MRPTREMRVCSRCGRSKPVLTEYPAKGGHFTDYCRACIRPTDGFRKLGRRR